MSNDFIQSYLDHTSIYESPTSFWKWSSYSAIAAVLRDNCYLNQGKRRLYPNIYTLFLAESGGRKGPPVDTAETLVAKVNNTKIISGRSSVQAILDELSRVETDKKTGKMTKAGSGVFFASEMSAAIVEDPSGLGILTDIYDYKSNPYKNRLRTGPCFNLERIVFSMLSASNMAMLTKLIGITEVEGGFIARTFLITPNEQRPPNSLMRLDNKKVELEFKDITDKFLKIADLNGEFKLEEDAINEYEKWYSPFKLAYQTKKESTGAVARIHTGIIKIAMILAANELQMSITKKHMEQAIDECIALLPNYNMFAIHKGRSQIADLGGILITALLEARCNMLSRKQILREHWRDFGDSELLDKLLATLEGAGMVVQHSTKEGIFFALTKYCLETMGSEQVQKKQQEQKDQRVN